jgi:hypothetical protein
MCLTNADALRRFFARAAGQRCAVGLVGDSNNNFSGNGWEAGITQALAGRIPIWSTGLTSINYNAGNGIGLPYQFRQSPGSNVNWRAATSNTIMGVLTGAPTFFDNLLPSGGWGHNYAYATGAATYSANRDHGLIINGQVTAQHYGDHPIDRRQALRGTVCYGTFASGGGSGKIGIRETSGSYTRSGTLNFATGADGYAFGQVDLAASASRNVNVQLAVMNDGTDALTTNAWFSFLQIENIATVRGVAVSTIAAQGGQSARDAYDWLQPRETMTRHILRNMMQCDGVADSAATALIVINEGANDFSESGTSIDTVNANSSRAGYKANIQGLIDVIQAAWVAEGFAAGNLFFLLLPTHVAAIDPTDSREAALIGYRDACAEIAAARANTAAADLRDVWNANTVGLPDAGELFWARSTGALTPDVNHGSSRMYSTLFDRVLDAALVSAGGNYLPLPSRLRGRF